jgi:hypothetical protein
MRTGTGKSKVIFTGITKQPDDRNKGITGTVHDFRNSGTRYLNGCEIHQHDKETPLRSYMIEELEDEKVDKIRKIFTDREWTSSIDGLYRIPVPEELLSPEQVEHEQCGPFYMAVETGRTWVRLELLVRASQILRCSCIAYATPPQRNAMIDTLDDLIRSNDIPV